MSVVRDENNRRVLAIDISDLHLSHKPPIFRSVEEDWYKTQIGYLNQVKELAEQYSAGRTGVLPVICNGDVFDDGWRSSRCPPSLINLAIKYLPKLYAVPGQHDLPYHDIEQIGNSAYWTLVEAGKIVNLAYGMPVEIGGIRLHGFPWGSEITPLKEPCDLLLEIAVIHSYIWEGSYGYPGASIDQNIDAYRKKLKGYDIALFGDNHKGFAYEGKDECYIFNCGTFMRRKLDEKEYQPSVGLIYSDGKVIRYPLDVSRDKYLTNDEVNEVLSGIGFQSLLEELSDLGDVSLEFAETVRRIAKREKTNPKVKEILAKLLDHAI